MNTLLTTLALMSVSAPAAVQTATTSTSAHAHHFSGGPSGPVPDVEHFVAMAIDAHPSIEARRRRALALRERIEPAGALHDPMLTVGMLNNPIDRLSFRSTPMTGVQLGLTQRLPWPGKLALSKDAAEETAAAASASSEEQGNAIARAVRLTYYDIHLTDVSVMVALKNVDIIEGFVEIADAKYRVGKGLQQDVLKARVQRDQIGERVIALKRMRQKQRVRLNNLLARPGSTEVPPLVNVPVRTFAGSVDAQPLLESAQRNRPRLAALNRRISAALARQGLADKQVLPDFTVGLGYRLRFPPDNLDPVDGADFWSLTLGVNLPVYAGSKQDPLSRAARQDVAAARQELEAALLDIRRVIEMELSQLPRYIEQMELYRTAIIPNTVQSLEADRIAYQVDRVDFLDLLDIEMRLFNFEVDYHRLHVAREQAIVRIAHAVGVPPASLGRTGKRKEP